MLKVAVTGGAGTGKTEVCDYLRRLGAHVIGLDELAREAVQPDSPVLEAIVDHFGKGVLKTDGSLDRRRLREIITKDAQGRKTLERLTHPEIIRLLEERFAAIESRYRDAIVVVEVPLLIEIGMQDRFDLVILVEAGPDQQRGRLMVRDGVSAAAAEALIGIQLPPEEKRPHADFIVENRASLEKLGAAVKEVHAKIARRT